MTGGSLPTINNVMLHHQGAANSLLLGGAFKPTHQSPSFGAHDLLHDATSASSMSAAVNGQDLLEVLKQQLTQHRKLSNVTEDALAYAHAATTAHSRTTSLATPPTETASPKQPSANGLNNIKISI